MTWAPKNWCFWTVVLKKTLGSPLDCQKIQSVYPKGNQSWIFIGRTDAEAETAIVWPPDAKSWLIGKDPDAGNDWGREEKGMTEDEMVGWHHWLNWLEYEQALGVGDGQKRKNRTRLSDWTEGSLQKLHLTVLDQIMYKMGLEHLVQEKKRAIKDW